MTDILAKREYKISEEKLSAELGCDVITVNGRSKKGLENLISQINSNLEVLKGNNNKTIIPYQEIAKQKDLVQVFDEIEEIVQTVFEPITPKEKIDLNSANKELKVLQPDVSNNGFSPDELTIRIDRILLHRVWGFLIFVVVMGITFTSIFWLAQPLMNLVDDLFASLF